MMKSEQAASIIAAGNIPEQLIETHFKKQIALFLESTNSQCIFE